MKTRLLKTSMAIIMALSMQAFLQAQTVSDFEDLTLSTNSYWDGSDTPLGTAFLSGNAIFPNVYDTAWGGYWASGWAYSNMTDTITEGFMNMFSAFAGAGYNNTDNYAVGTQGSVLQLTGDALGKALAGFYVTNGTYPALSMKNGDFSGKKFGGATGDDPDWFKLTIKAFYNGSLKDDSVEFYLADYRFPDNAFDYIIKEWEWVDLTTLGNADSLIFALSSSDNDPLWGMNTPAFFCIDNFTTLDSPASVNEGISEALFHFYPNPVNDILYIISSNNSEEIYVEIYNSAGQLVLSQKQTTQNGSCNMSSLTNGIYFLKLRQGNDTINHTFVK